MEVLGQLLTNLEINSTIFVMAAIFLGTYAIAHFLFLKKLSVLVVERENRTHGRESSFEHLGEELKELTVQLELQKRSVQAESSKLFAEFKAKAATEQSAIMKTARDRANVDLKSARAVIQADFDREVKKAEQEVPALAKQIVARLLTPQKKILRSDDTRSQKGL